LARPSPAIGALTAYLRARAPEVDVTPRHDHVHVAHAIGPSLYELVAEHAYRVGELLAAATARLVDQAAEDHDLIGPSTSFGRPRDRAGRHRGAVHRYLARIGKGTSTIQNLQAMKVLAELGIRNDSNLTEAAGSPGGIPGCRAARQVKGGANG
jgi:hypothetical protein